MKISKENFFNKIGTLILTLVALPLLSILLLPLFIIYYYIQVNFKNFMKMEMFVLEYYLQYPKNFFFEWGRV